MFEDQTVELLPARTTMKKWGNGKRNNNRTTNIAANYSNVEIDGDDNKVVVVQVAAAGNTFH
jgi:hypothetical protein